MTPKKKIEKARQHYHRRLVEANGRNDEKAKTVARETFRELKSHYKRLNELEGDVDVPEVEGYDSWYEFKQDRYF